MTYIVDVVWLLLLIAALWAPGEVLARLLGRRCPAMAKDVTPQIALGMGVWSLALFVLAAAGLLRERLLVGLFWVAVVWSGWRLIGLIAAWRQRAPTLPLASLEILLAVIALLAASITAVLTSYPTVGWDDAVYHLRLPALYLDQHAFSAPRFLLYARWPQNLEMLYALALAVRGFVLAKLLHAGCGVLLCIATYRLGRLLASRVAAIGGALLVAASPLVLEGAQVANVDLAVAFLFVQACEAVARAAQGDSPRRHLVLAGVFGGLAAGTKLTGWNGTLILLALWLLRSRGGRATLRPALIDGALLVLPAVALASPWYFKSWLETGNPVYPLLYGVFGGADWSAELAASAARWQRGIGMGRSALDYVLLPFRVFAFGAQGYGSFDGELGRYWLAIVPFAIAAGWREPRVRWCLLAGGMWFGLWAVGPQQARFLIPALPLLAAAAAGATQELSPRGGIWRSAARAFAGSAGLLLAIHLLEPARAAREQHATWPHVASQARSQVCIVPAAWAYLESETPPDARVLFLNNNRVYPLSRPALADSIFEASQIAAWLQPAATVDALRERLHSERVTHILLERVDWGIAWPASLTELLATPALAAPVFESGDRRFVVYALRQP